MRGRVRHYPWPDHHPPPFRLLPMVLASMRRWLNGEDGLFGEENGNGAGEGEVKEEKESSEVATTITETSQVAQDTGEGSEMATTVQESTIQTVATKDGKEEKKKRVVVVHCKAGKGRSGTVSVSFLIAERGRKPEDALARFTERRMRKGLGEGVSIPSQLRWVSYVDRWANVGGRRYVDHAVEIVEIHVWGLRNGVKLSVEGFVDEGKRIKVFHTFTRDERIIVEGNPPGGAGFIDMVYDMAGFAVADKVNPARPEDKNDEVGLQDIKDQPAPVDGGDGNENKQQHRRPKHEQRSGSAPNLIAMRLADTLALGKGSSGEAKIVSSTKSAAAVRGEADDGHGSDGVKARAKVLMQKVSSRTSIGSSSGNRELQSRGQRSGDQKSEPLDTSTAAVDDTAISDGEVAVRKVHRHSSSRLSVQSTASSPSASSSSSGSDDRSKQQQEEPGGRVVIFRPHVPVRLPNSDVNIAIERRSRAPTTLGLAMVTSVAHVWFNVFFEGGGPERRNEREGVFSIDWDAMDGIKGSTRKGTRAADRISVVWRIVDGGGRPRAGTVEGKAGMIPEHEQKLEGAAAAAVEVSEDEEASKEVREPPPGSPVPQMRAADWQGGDADKQDPDAGTELGLLQSTGPGVDDRADGDAAVESDPDGTVSKKHKNHKLLRSRHGNHGGQDKHKHDYDSDNDNNGAAEADNDKGDPGADLTGTS